jgi:hypothetical protein
MACPGQRWHWQALCQTSMVCESVSQQIEEMMCPYLEFIKSQCPHLRYWRVGELWTERKTKSQYEKCKDQVHSDYLEEVMKQDPPNHPMLMKDTKG